MMRERRLRIWEASTTDVTLRDKTMQEVAV
jgi:hypothetical protein